MPDISKPEQDQLGAADQDGIPQKQEKLHTDGQVFRESTAQRRRAERMGGRYSDRLRIEEIPCTAEPFASLAFWE